MGITKKEFLITILCFVLGGFFSASVFILPLPENIFGAIYVGFATVFFLLSSGALGNIIRIIIYALGYYLENIE